MYYLLYVFFYLLSLLPFRVIYLLADVIYGLLYYVTGYRKGLVIKNLRLAFPGKSDIEIKRISKKFYRNFVDTWLEMVKIMSMSPKVARKRMQCDFGLLHELYKTGQPVQLYAGHFMNWEYINVCVPINQPFPFLGVYMPITSKAMERLIFKLRSRFGSILLKAGKMKEEMQPWLEKQYLIGLAADQSPSNPGKAYWLQYLNRPTGFVDGPWIRACQLNQPTVYLSIRKITRGYYKFETIPFEQQPATRTPVEMMRKFARLLEKEIEEAPELYLWSHRRWKHAYKPEYAANWVDEKIPSPHAQHTELI